MLHQRLALASPARWHAREWSMCVDLTLPFFLLSDAPKRDWGLRHADTRISIPLFTLCQSQLYLAVLETRCNGLGTAVTAMVPGRL